MKKLLLTLLLAPALAASLSAGTFKLPDDDPVASITIPDSWEPEEVKRGVEAKSPDGEVYMAVEFATSKNIDKVTTEGIDFLKEQGVTIDKSTQKENKFEVNGMEVQELIWTGKDKDGDAIVSLAFVGVSDTKALMVTYWASPEGEKKNQAALGKILQTLKKIGK